MRFMGQMYLFMAASVYALTISCSKPEAPKYIPRPSVVSQPKTPIEPNYCVQLADELRKGTEEVKGQNIMRKEWVTATGSLFLVGGGDGGGSIENPALATPPQLKECQSRLELMIK